MKVHLVSSPDPIRRGTDVIALCGAELQRVQFVFTVIGDLQTDGSLRLLGNCMECHIKKLRGRYLYGASEGKEEICEPS